MPEKIPVRRAIDVHREDELKDTLRKTAALLKEDQEAQALALKVRHNPKPEAIAEFIACAERKIEKFRFDLPGWEGNMFFASNIVKTDRYMQGGCWKEAEHAAAMIQALKDGKYLPEDAYYGHVTTGAHWALAVFQDQKANGFILDTWLVSTGKPAAVFSSHDDWVRRCGAASEKECKAMETARRDFSKNLILLQDAPNPTDYFTGIRRKFDESFLQAWSERNVPKRAEFRFEESTNYAGPVNGASHEAAQDFIVCTYFLGREPKLPGSEMNETFYKSLRDRIAHIIRKDAENPVMRKSGLVADAVEKCTTFAELKPHLEKFYRAYNPAIEPVSPVPRIATDPPARTPAR